MPNKREKDDNILSDFDELENDDIQQETIEENQLDLEHESEEGLRADEKKELERGEPVKKGVGGSPDESLLDVTSNVTVNVTAVIGRTNVTIRELMEYKNGTIVDLHRSPGETVDIVAGERLVARGELVDMDGRLGVRILKVLR